MSAYDGMESPRGPDGRYSSSQKGKGRPVLLPPKDITLSTRSAHNPDPGSLTFSDYQTLSSPSAGACLSSAPATMAGRVDGNGPPATPTPLHKRSSIATTNNSAHKRFRLHIDPFLFHSAILTVPEQWCLPFASAAIIGMIRPWQRLFATCEPNRTLPLPTSAYHASPPHCFREDRSSRVFLLFDRSSLTEFLNLWRAHHHRLPELHDVEIKRYSLDGRLQQKGDNLIHGRSDITYHSLSPNVSYNTSLPISSNSTSISPLKVMSWNINGRYLLNLHSSSTFQSLLRNADIILLQATRLQSESAMRCPEGFTSYLCNRRRLDLDLDIPWGRVATLKWMVFWCSTVTYHLNPLVPTGGYGRILSRGMLSLRIP
ncbi:hypothetical protein EV360DRAFT_90302 [Lentinula raphanica]|nr:hypothetical protein EV360DRAFT_90302 [Lentinula raphanica]